MKMKVAFGIKAHSGWAVLVGLGMRNGELEIVDRIRLELVEPKAASWAKQPYHAAEELSGRDARNLVNRAINSARRMAVREMRKTLKRMEQAGRDVSACAVLVGEPMPDWSVAEILAVHFRMHQAEGVLFRDALIRAADTCGIKTLEVREKQFEDEARRVIGTELADSRKAIADAGKVVGPPWGKDQKDAALAALIALKSY